MKITVFVFLTSLCAGAISTEASAASACALPGNWTNSTPDLWTGELLQAQAIDASPKLNNIPMKGGTIAWVCNDQKASPITWNTFSPGAFANTPITVTLTGYQVCSNSNVDACARQFQPPSGCGNSTKWSASSGGLYVCTSGTGIPVTCTPSGAQITPTSNPGWICGGNKEHSHLFGKNKTYCASLWNYHSCGTIHGF